MIFNSFNFIVLFPLIFLLYYAIPAKYCKARNMYLLFVSYLLYLQWEPVYALILLGVTAATYYSALLVEKAKRPKQVLPSSESYIKEEMLSFPKGLKLTVREITPSDLINIVQRLMPIRKYA